VCTAPAPLFGRAYVGSTSQHRSLRVSVARSHRRVALTSKGLRFSCADGTTLTDDVALGRSDDVRVGRTGTFRGSYTVEPDPEAGTSHELVTIVGAFDGHRAAGAIVGNVQIAGHGICTTGKVTWRAHG
jgi:hypothetical protein